MPQITADTSQMSDFSPSQPNTYRARIVSVELVRSKGDPAKGKAPINGIQPKFEFEAPRLDNGEVRTVTRTSWLPVEGKGTFGFDQLLRCTGFAEAADAIKKGGAGFETDDLVGRECNLVIVTELYTPQGQTQPRQQDGIDSFLPL